MRVLIEDALDVLDSPLTDEERGVLFTLYLLREHEPDIALMRAKKYLKFRAVKPTLMMLHEEGFIEWSGYTKAKKSLKKQEEEVNPAIEEVLKFLSELKGQRFAPNKTNTKQLIARLGSESVEDIKAVITNRYEEWKDTDSWKYFRPQTIFRKSKFDKYLDEVKRTGKGKALLQVKNIGLEEDDLITYEISKNLLDKSSYKVKIYMASSGKKFGTGRIQTMLGKAIKRELKMQNDLVKAGGEIDSLYYYQEK